MDLVDGGGRSLGVCAGVAANDATAADVAELESGITTLLDA